MWFPIVMVMVYSVLLGCWSVMAVREYKLQDVRAAREHAHLETMAAIERRTAEHNAESLRLQAETERLHAKTQAIHERVKKHRSIKKGI